MLAQKFIRLFIFFVILFSPLSVATQAAEVVAQQVLPHDTDAEITEFNSPHYTWTPNENQQHKLVLFLPGTHGEPRPNFPFAQFTSGLGYHTIFLMYPDEIAAQSACARSSDPDAHFKFRMNTIVGGGDVSKASSIENRLVKLLSYLSEHYPKQEWKQFCAKDGAPEWSKIIVAGQSQGGGHAYIIGKMHKVSRVLMFGSPKDYSTYFNAPPKHFDDDTKTPLNQFFAFNHVHDQKGTYEREVKILDQIGLTKYGITNVDKTNSPYANARVLFTDEATPNGNNHGGPIGGKLSCCIPVWTYMLTTAE